MPQRKRRQPAAPPPPAPPALDPRQGLAGVCVFLGAALLPWLGRRVPLGEQATPEVAYGQLVLGVLFLTAALLAPRPGLRRDRATAALIVLFAIGVISLLVPRPGPLVEGRDLGVALEPLDTRLPADLEAGLRELARLGVVILAAVAAASVRRGWSLGGLLCGAAFAGLFGLREYLLQLRAGDPSWRVFAGFASPNALAAYLIVVLPLAAAAVGLAREGGAPPRWLAGQQVDRPALKLRGLTAALALLLLLVLGLTGSRAGLLGLMAMVAATGAALLRRGAKRAALVALAGGGGAALLALLGPLRSRVLAAATQSHSMRFRFLTWSGTWDLALHHPLLGVGLGGWATAYPVYARASFTQHAHSGWLQQMADTGVVGLLVYVALFVLWAATAWQALASDDPDRRLLGTALLAAVAGFAVHNAFDLGWYLPSVACGLAMLGAATSPAAAPVPAAEPEAAEPARARSSRRWLLAGGGVAVVALLAATALAEGARARGQAALGRGSLQGAVREFEAALARAPWSGLAAEDLAGVLVYADPDEADAAYRRAIGLRPMSARVRYRYANYLDAAGQVEPAMSQSALGVALSPLHLQGYLQLGNLLEQADRPEAARQVYERLDAVALSPAIRDANPTPEYLFEPTHGYGLMRLAALALEAGDPAVACDAWARAVAEFERYLATYEREEALMADFPAAERRELLRLRGLEVEEREDVRELLERARAGRADAGCAP